VYCQRIRPLVASTACVIPYVVVRKYAACAAWWMETPCR
jgi:hypothetical protein